MASAVAGRRFARPPGGVPVLDDVLLVADDFDVALRVKWFLEQSGLKVLLVEAGRQVTALATLLLPAAIVLDADLPDGEGVHICQALKDRPVTQDIPLVVLGSWPDGVLDALADGSVVKGPGLERCLRQLLEHLGVLCDCRPGKPVATGPGRAET